MSISGPKPKPAEIAEAQGNPGHRPVTHTPDAVPVIAGSEAPDYLSERGKAIWADLIKRFRAIPFVKTTDALVLGRYCDHVDRWLRLREKVGEMGEAYETKSRHGDMLRVNPYFRAMLAVEEKMAQIEINFGLTPAARQSILARYRPEDDQGDTLNDAAKPASSDASSGHSSPLGMFAPMQGVIRPN